MWFTFSIRNTHATDTLHLYIDPNPHRMITLFNGDSIIAERGTLGKNESIDRFGSPLTIFPGGQHTYWLKVEERIRYLTPLFIHLETPHTYYKHLTWRYKQERWLRFLMPIMAGFLLLIGIFGCFQCYLSHDVAYAYYSLYALCAFLLTFYVSEDRLDLVVFSSVTIDVLDSILWNAVPAAYIMFVGNVLKLKIDFPKAWILCKVLLTILIIQSCLSYTEYFTNRFLFSSNVYYSYLIGLPGLFSACVLLAVSIKSKSPVKRFMIFGLTSLLLFFFLPICIGFSQFFSGLPYIVTSILDYGPFFFVMGMCVEATCFAFALAYRSKLIAIENNGLQANYAKDLKYELAIRANEIQQQNKIVEEQKIKQIEAEFEQKIAETEMTALRAQMNPHFIFNCLNSIKLYTLENDSAIASEYLNKFSTLIRLVLENSRSEKVTLQKELKTLQLYIELEAMRFKNKLQFKFKIDETIEQDFIEIPPLLLQPYIENAIWHGLMHKKEGGFILVNISQPSESLIRVEITDNGIGRALSEQYKSKSATLQKSFGMKMTSERINIINQIYQTNTSVEIIDLKDGNHFATGTKVIIHIPL